MKADFYQLYRRSCYGPGSGGVVGESRTAHHQKELFAVAALGFLLRHNPEFRQKFLEQICMLPGLGRANCEIRCQDGHQSDLALVWPGQCVLVIECKVFAGLMRKQDPSTPDFYLEPDGYGLLIKGKYPKEPRRYYLVLGAQAGSGTEPPPVAPVEFLGFHSWSELVDLPGSAPLLGDFLDCLGRFGLPALGLRSFHGMTMRNETVSAATIFKLLEGVAQKFGFKPGKEFWDVGSEPGLEFVGVNILLQDRFSALHESLRPEGNRLGWFGYESTSGGDSRLACWFYPSQAAMPQAMEFVRQRTGITPQQPEPHSPSFYVTPDPADQADDLTWFCDVLKRLSEASTAGAVSRGN